MENRLIQLMTLMALLTFLSCAQNDEIGNKVKAQSHQTSDDTTKKQAHNYGGWYCPDNLIGFPAVGIADWRNVPVINGRMPTEEETKTSSSLIYVDPEKHPDAQPLDMTMPKLAKYDNDHTKEEELVIAIQAFRVDKDSIIGFRFLNGGNGSARLHELEFLSDEDVKKLPPTSFVAHQLEINAPQDSIWQVLTKKDYLSALRPTFDPQNQLPKGWRTETKVNYRYGKLSKPVAIYANKIFGSFYIQNDFGLVDYTEKFLLLEDEDGRRTTMTIACGPFGDDFEEQKAILYAWGQKVKALSEK